MSTILWTWSYWITSPGLNSLLVSRITEFSNVHKKSKSAEADNTWQYLPFVDIKRFGGSLRWWRSFAFVNMSKLAEKVASCCLGEITQARVTRKLWRLTRLRTWSGELQVDTGICVIGSLNHAAQVRLVVNYATTETDFWQQWMQMDAGFPYEIYEDSGWTRSLRVEFRRLRRPDLWGSRYGIPSNDRGNCMLFGCVWNILKQMTMTDMTVQLHAIAISFTCA